LAKANYSSRKTCVISAKAKYSSRKIYVISTEGVQLHRTP